MKTNHQFSTKATHQCLHPHADNDPCVSGWDVAQCLGVCPLCRRPWAQSLHICLWYFCFQMWLTYFWKQMLDHSWGSSWGMLFHPHAEATSTNAELPAVPQVCQGVRTGVWWCHIQYRKAATQSGKRMGEEGDTFLCILPSVIFFEMLFFNRHVPRAAHYTPVTS